MTNRYEYEHTDTFCGEANYCWVNRGAVEMPELTHYGYDGSNGYAKANKAMERQLVRKVKAEIGLTGHPCARDSYGDEIVLRPRGLLQIVFIRFAA